ncbi:hypothetical protein E2C01_040900 [Portunus trituberculatus]|uniref:Uncharacterized protein n=1 Tax=Portunus trituberculatus TaxID=210409 RepID=A0A5B7FS14_PORTR|nr:hypothetical protein [Portunus trituberculatus]
MPRVSGCWPASFTKAMAGNTSKVNNIPESFAASSTASTSTPVQGAHLAHTLQIIRTSAIRMLRRFWEARRCALYIYVM